MVHASIPKDQELKAERGMALNLELAWAIQSEPDAKSGALYLLSTHYNHWGLHLACPYEKEI